MTDEESVAIVLEVKDMALALRDARAQRDKLREALATSMRYFDQVIVETGYQSEGERIAHEKARAALAAIEEE